MINNNCRHGSRKKRGFLHYYYLKYRLCLQTSIKHFVERKKITKVLIVRFIRVFSYTCIVTVHDQDINPMMMYYKCSTILLFICLYLLRSVFQRYHIPNYYTYLSNAYRKNHFLIKIIDMQMLKNVLVLLQGICCRCMNQKICQGRHNLHHHTHQ